MPPQARATPANEPVKVEVVRVAQPGRDGGWWITTVGSVVVPALALVVAIILGIDQHGAEQTAQNAAARTYASEVSFIPASTGPPQYEIDNNANAQITSVLVLPAAHARLQSLGTIQPCKGVIFSLPSASSPTIYFRDANGLGWRLPLDGVAQQSADPTAILDLVPYKGLSTLPFIEAPSKPVHVC